MRSKCIHHCCENNINSSYIKWILEVLGPVIMGSKPSEILNISFKDPIKNEKLNDIVTHFSNCKKISYEIIDQGDKGFKILFINYNTLEKVLDNKKSISFLKFLGYPRKYEFNTYLNYLLDKLRLGILPDEIGIFLGYPLKDVVGFMGYGNYEFHNTKYWRVYGDPTISQDVYNNFLNHRIEMRKLISNSTTEEIFRACL